MIRNLGKIFTALMLVAMFTVNGLACNRTRYYRTGYQQSYAPVAQRYDQRAYYAPNRNYCSQTNETYYRPYRGHSTRDKILTVAVPAAVGASIGAIAGGGKGAGIGALVGGGGGGLFYLLTHRR